MIEIEDGMDRGAGLYAKYPMAITAMVKNRKSQYFESQQYRGLKNNCRNMDLYIDNASPAVSSFISDITPPVIRRAYNEFGSLFTKFLETDPLFSVTKNKNLSVDKMHKIQAVINDNLDTTYYRERCLQWTIDDIVRYGTAVTYSFACNDYNANSLMTIKGDDKEFGDYKQIYGQGQNAVISTPIHPLNAIIDPRANFQVSPDYMGFIGDISVSNLKGLLDNEAYVQKNLKSVFEKCKKGMPDEFWWAGDNTEVKDYSRGHSNITYLWMRLPIEGNEDDPTWYAIEVIGDEIIRIEENALDSNTIPISIKRIFPRKYQWYGNSPLVDKICVQNMQYWLINNTVESTARLMDRIVLYREGTLDVEAINSRHSTGGLVPYRGQEQNLSNLMYGVPLPNSGYRETDWLMQEMRREDQETSMIPNFNPQSEGGPTNKTLGGAQMMASIGEMRSGFLVGQMCVGLKDVAKHQLVLLRNIINDTFETSNGQSVEKEDLLGDVSFNIKTSNVFNYIREGMDAENRLNNVINRRATKIPQFMAIKLQPLIEDSLRNSLKRENIDDYINSDMLRVLDEKDQQRVMQPPPPPPPPPMPPMGGGMSMPPTGRPTSQPDIIGASNGVI